MTIREMEQLIIDLGLKLRWSDERISQLEAEVRKLKEKRFKLWRK